MSEKFYKDLPFRVCCYYDETLILTKFCKSKDEAIKYFNCCVAAIPSDNYWYEIYDDSNVSLLFSTKE